MTRRELFAALGITTYVASAGAEQQEPSVRLQKPYQVVVGPTATALTSTGLVRGVALKAISPGYTIYIGTDNTVSSLTGWPLADNDSIAFDISEASQLWVIASGANQRVAVLPYR